MSVALVALATGLGARYPRFSAENLTQVAGSYGGIAFMVMAVLFILVEIALLAWPSFRFLWMRFEGTALSTGDWLAMGASLAAAFALSIVVARVAFEDGVRSLESLRD
jgi:hypothetical protein